MKVLRCGDPHAKVSNLEEMDRLVDFIAKTATERKVDRIEILGDLYHSHAVLRLEVQEFWTRSLLLLSSIAETVVLVGNHDLSGDYNSKFSSLSTFTLMNIKNLVVVEKPLCLGIIGYVPYIHNHDAFISNAIGLRNNGANVLVCHQTIQGSKYESGIYAPDGVETGEWSEGFEHVISGHIHSEQNFGNIIYPGTARWDTTADANQRKGIWIYTHNDNTGKIEDSEFVSTEKVCNPIVEITWNEGEPEPTVPSHGKVSLVLKGSSDWVNKEKIKYKGKVSLKTKYTDSKRTETRKIGLNFEDFLKNHYANSSNKEELVKLAKEMNIV